MITPISPANRTQGKALAPPVCKTGLPGESPGRASNFPSVFHEPQITQRPKQTRHLSGRQVEAGASPACVTIFSPQRSRARDVTAACSIRCGVEPCNSDAPDQSPLPPCFLIHHEELRSSIRQSTRLWTGWLMVQIHPEPLGELRGSKQLTVPLYHSCSRIGLGFEPIETVTDSCGCKSCREHHFPGVAQQQRHSA